MNDMDLPKAYEPKEYEDKIYKKWEKSGYFNPDNLKTSDKAPSFTISMPPPNATGVLHVGHTLGITVQDIMIRYYRMKGDKTLMLPGTDHAAIATQNVVEKMLRKEGTSRHKLGREKFLKRTNEYVEQNKATINNQTRKMGASCDWSREAYTMSDQLSVAVNTQFKNMYDDGLIYRGERVVNWCPRCHSTLADDEVEYQEIKGKLYWIKYGPFVLATTRPETKLGDTAVAVHPDDKRYKKMVGKKYMIPGVLGEFEITVIADRAVDKDFGSGAVKVTPSHSFTDSQMAARHNIAGKKIIDEDGKMMANCGKYAGMKTVEAREVIVKDMEKMGLMDHVDDDYNLNLSVCYRCSTAIEPLPSLQWFVAVDKKFKLKNPALIKSFGKKETTLKEISTWAVKSGQIKMIPEHFTKTYFHWMDNLRDWCISRQIWFGHRIPVYYKKDEIHVGLDKPRDSGWTQDEDTLDTWFSSGLWTFSTLGWPNEKSKDLKTFHPTSVMETMHDILFFWVARMIIMSLYSLNEVPFKTVYLHGMVQDKHGKKMSKSHPETIIEPIEIAEKYGTDALRLSMVVGNAAGNNIKLSEQKIAGFRNFANKLWNIGRFIQMNYKDGDNNPKAKTLADKWIVSRLNSLTKEVTDDIDNFRFGLAGEKLYNFTWHELADWYVEISKVQNDKNTYSILNTTYSTLLKLLHPFTPFVTEKIWEYFGDKNLLMVEKWPEVDDKKIDTESEKDFKLIKELVTAIRSWRKENKKEPKEVLKCQIAVPDELIESQKKIINQLAKVDLETVDKLTGKDLEVGNLQVKF